VAAQVLERTDLRKINVGCGYDKREGYLNVDMDPACAPDLLIADNNFTNLPRKHYEVLLAHDVLEHIPRAESLNALLEWADLIAPAGTLQLQTSNIVAIGEMMKAVRTYERHHVYTTFCYGNQMHPGDYHFTGFTDITLRVLLVSAGFEVRSFEETDTWLYAVEGRKVVDWTGLLDRSDLSDHDFVREAYVAALDREPEALFIPGDVQQASEDRRGLLKKLYGSEERRLRVAQKLGF
jgi:predicted SAM-dependent methyltransferase